MIFNIVLKSTKDDDFSVAESAEEKSISLPPFNYEGGAYPISHNINRILSQYKLSPSEEISDFMNLGLAVYCSDQLISRAQYGFFNWSRHFKLHLPVMNKELWDNNKELVEQLLSFLSGDKWEIFFRSRNNYFNETLGVKPNIANVCLFSGGLDSFVGGINALEEYKDTVLVSHHKGGNSGEKTIQSQLAITLKEEFELKDITHFSFFVQPHQKNNPYGKESSQRARSILFIALGLFVANSYGDKAKLLIPENGLISLNVPLTKTRLGSYSTKTTHPKFVDEINKLLHNLEIENKLINPYGFFTKGEMLQNCKRPDILKKYVSKTLSCAKVGHSQQWYHAVEKQCGYCTPCIIRRSAIKKAEFDNYDSKYFCDIVSNPPSPKKKSGRDLRAFKIGIERFNSDKEKVFFSLLSAGSLPGSEKDLQNYLDVYKRGMKEVEEFIK